MTTAALADLFPARVTYPEGSHPGFKDKVRVLLFADRAIIFGETKRRDIEVVHDVRLIGFTKPIAARVGYELQLETGEMWVVGRGTGCGCGSPLKRAQQRELLQRAPEEQPA